MALEALYAARHLAASPKRGPWLKPTTDGSAWHSEVQDIARMTSLMLMSRYAGESPHADLVRHITDLEYVTPNDAWHWHATPVRGEVLVRDSPAGTPGNKDRTVVSKESRSGNTFLSIY